MIQNWLKNSKSILRSGYLWNTAAASVTAGQSAVIMIFITHMLGIENAGIFGIAYAFALLFSTYSKYGIRNFQVTDVKEQYTYGEYAVCRAISILSAFIVIIVYLAIQFTSGRYSLYKALIIMFVSIWKQTDSIEDVIYGMYQQQGRFDVASKCFFLRQFFSTVLFCVLVMMRIDLLVDCIVVAAASLLFMIYLVISTRELFQVNHSFTIRRSLRVLMECVTLCISGTVSNYVCNAPKYVIDRCMDDVNQAYFGYIMMPAYVIVMFSGFFFTPLLKDIGEMVFYRKILELKRCFIRQFCIVLLLTSGVALAAFFVGIPLLSVIYGVELEGFKGEMLLLVLGAGIYALLVFISALLTAMRRQNSIALVYSGGAVLFYVLGEWLVNKLGMLGVSIAYLGMNILLVLILGGVFFKSCISMHTKKISTE